MITVDFSAICQNLHQILEYPWFASATVSETLKNIGFDSSITQIHFWFVDPRLDYFCYTTRKGLPCTTTMSLPSSPHCLPLATIRSFPFDCCRRCTQTKYDHPWISTAPPWSMYTATLMDLFLATDVDFFSSYSWCNHWSRSWTPYKLFHLVYSLFTHGSINVVWYHLLGIEFPTDDLNASWHW